MDDDASGTTAVAEMAKYFSVSQSNKRSILLYSL
jgi:Zn-dependent M28 family amino/carboxypeptidase